MDFLSVVTEILGTPAGYESLAYLVAAWVLIYCLSRSFAVLAHVFRLVDGGRK